MVGVYFQMHYGFGLLPPKPNSAGRYCKVRPAVGGSASDSAALPEGWKLFVKNENILI